MGLNNGLHNMPLRIELGQSSMAPPPFNNNNNIDDLETVRLIIINNNYFHYIRHVTRKHMNRVVAPDYAA